MKNLISVFVILVFLMSCASQPDANTTASSNPGQTAAQGSGQAAGAALPNTAARNNYGSGIILDGAQRYTVVRGDTLARIARTRYNNGYLYPLIYIASRNVVSNPDFLRPGMVLTIPNLSRNLLDPTARANLKNMLLEMAVFEEQRGRVVTARDMRNLANGL